MYRTNFRLRSKLLREGEPGDPNAGGGGATPPVDEGLNDAGKAAIQRERDAAKEAVRGKAAAVSELDKVRKELDELRGATQSDWEKALTAAKKEAKAEVLSAANNRLIRAEIRAAAAGLGFHDPADAAVQLHERFGEVKVSDDGDVDGATVKSLIEKLAADKPYLVKTDGKAAPLPGQGHHPKPPSSGREQGLAEAAKRFPKPA